MQSSLFGDLDDGRPETATRNQKPKSAKSTSEPGEPELTLFGVSETKAQARKRARRIAHLVHFLREAPQALTCFENDISVLGYFIERGADCALTPNDIDGLLRFVGDMQELLSEDDLREMHEREDIWKPYPPGWLGKLRGEVYAAALHFKEIAWLMHLQDERRNEIADLSAAVQEATLELARLKAICPLPPDVAAEFSLTPADFDQ